MNRPALPQILAIRPSADAESRRPVSEAVGFPPCVHIVGLKNAGKTTLLLDLLPELQRRGYRVGTIKHSPHGHTLDTPGKDSFRHREAGASPSAFVTASGTALYLDIASGENPYQALAPHYRGCDLVLVEGDLSASGPRIEVWREELGRPPLSMEHPGIAAVVSDDPMLPPLVRWPRTPVAALAGRIITLALRSRSAAAPGFALRRSGL